MHAGWREYLKQRFQKSSEYFSVGLEFGRDAVILCVLKKHQQSIQWVKQHQISTHNWLTELNQYVEHQALKNTPCHIVLGASHYQLLQVDRPAVPDAEIAQSLVWTIKDLVTLQGDLAVEYFDFPAQSAGANKINAVAILKKELESILHGITDSGLVPKSVGIVELAVADVIPNTEDAVLTLIQEKGQEVCLNIIKRGQVYFSRRLRGYENLATFSKQELQLGAGDNLSIEIQRSMDYFESQLRQAPVKKIMLGIDSPTTDDLASLLQQLTFMPVESIQAPICATDDMTFSSRYLGSLGAACAQQSGLPHEI